MNLSLKKSQDFFFSLSLSLSLSGTNMLARSLKLVTGWKGCRWTESHVEVENDNGTEVRSISQIVHQVWAMHCEVSQRVHASGCCSCFQGNKTSRNSRHLNYIYIRSMWGLSWKMLQASNSLYPPNMALHKTRDFGLLDGGDIKYSTARSTVTPYTALQLWRAIVDPDSQSCSRHRATVSMKDDNASIAISSGKEGDGTGRRFHPYDPRFFRSWGPMSFMWCEFEPWSFSCFHWDDLWGLSQQNDTLEVCCMSCPLGFDHPVKNRETLQASRSAPTKRRCDWKSDTPDSYGSSLLLFYKQYLAVPWIDCIILYPIFRHT